LARFSLAASGRACCSKEKRQSMTVIWQRHEAMPGGGAITSRPAVISTRSAMRVKGARELLVMAMTRAPACLASRAASRVYRVLPEWETARRASSRVRRAAAVSIW
jgi:hypothetical protein